METPINTYPNEQAHGYLKSLMQQGKILEMFFNVDKFGKITFRIKAQDITPFDYQISYSGFLWILEYLFNGTYNDKDVDIHHPMEVENETLDSLQKSNFKVMLDENWGEVQQAGKFYDKKGRIQLYLNFNKGLIHFFMIPDEDIINYMKSKGLKVEE